MDKLLVGLHTIATWQALLVIPVGTIVGIIFGVLPGIGTSVSIALVLPFTFKLSPAMSLLLLAAVYLAGEYGGSISAILLGAPGTPAASATVLDGYALNRKGQPTKALAYSIFASTIGGFVGVLVLVFLSGPVAAAAISFGPPEFFALGIFGLTAVASLSGGSVVRGGISVAFGLLLSTIGIDVFTGYPRFAFGKPVLFNGIPLLPVLIGLFAISEVFRLVGEEWGAKKRYDVARLGQRIWLSWREFRRVSLPIALGSVIGSFIGIFPGLGAGPASWIAYTQARNVSKRPETFGEGNPEGIAAPESANNAAVGGALIPLLTLGIPGSPATAVMLGALIIQGVQPGPDIFAKHPDVIYGLFVGLLIATVVLGLFALMFTKLFAQVVRVPIGVLAPMIMFVALTGAFVLRGLLSDVWFTLMFGVIGYAMRKFDFSLPAGVLGFILGPMIERNLRRTLLISNGDYAPFVTHPISAVLLGLSVISIAIPFLQRRAQRRRVANADGHSGQEDVGE